jgi:hypothetical protein
MRVLDVVITILHFYVYFVFPGASVLLKLTLLEEKVP